MKFKAVYYPLLALLGGCFGVDRPHPPSSYVIEHIPHTETQDTYQRFDVVNNAEGTLHLVWQTGSDGLNYQASRDAGRTWSEPVLLAKPPSMSAGSFYSLQNRPRVFVEGDTVVVFWQEPPSKGIQHRLRRLVSYDGGRTWSEGPGEPKDVYKTREGRHVLLAEGQRLYLAYTSRDGFFARYSNDLGARWTAPVRITGLLQDSRSMNSVHVSLALGEDRLYALLGEREGRLRLAESPDKGAHWSEPVEIPLDLAQFGQPYEKTNQVSFSSLALTVSDEALLVCFVMKSTFFYQEINRAGRVLVEPQRINDASISLDIGVLSEPGGSLRVAWADRSYKESSWWTKTPLAILDFDGPGGLWANNDLVMSTVEAGVPGEPEVVTPRLSSVLGQGGQGPQFLRTGPDRLYLFWSGRRKVGKTADAYGYPTEILFTVLSE